jgi:hypothetical protein
MCHSVWDLGERNLQFRPDAHHDASAWLGTNVGVGGGLDRKPR